MLTVIIDKAVRKYIKYRDPSWLREIAEAMVTEGKHNEVRVWKREASWAREVFRPVSVHYNLRTNDGIDYVCQQLGSAGSAASATNIARWMAVGSADYTPASTHRSLNSATQGVTTSEWTSNGLTRAQATPAHTAGVTNYTLTNTFTVTTGTSVAYTIGEFDRSAAASSILFLTTDITNTTLNVNDQLQITHTVNV